MSFWTRAMRVQEVALCVARNWWRPITCLGIAGSVITNGVIIPFIKHDAVDMTGLATLITAATAAFAVRTYEKIKGPVQ